MQDIIIPGGPFNIGQAAEFSGVSAKMVRHYETLGLFPNIRRTDSGYRQYGPGEVHILRFIRRGRDLGFSMAEITSLLKLYGDKDRASKDVKRIALEHAAELSRRIAEMQAMQRTLEHLAGACHGDDRPDCPILDDLGGMLHGNCKLSVDAKGSASRTNHCDRSPA